MSIHELNKKFQPLPGDPIPAWNQELVSKITSPRDIHASGVGEFNAVASLSSFKEKSGQRGIALECGGNSIRGSEFIVDDNGDIQTNQSFVRKHVSKDSEGYLELLEEFAKYASEKNLPVGIAFGGPIDGTVPLVHPKFVYLRRELGEKYDGDLANLFNKTSLSVLNDCPAGLISGACQVAIRSNSNQTVIYLINGGGLNTGVYKNGQLYTNETGHLAAPASLNPFNLDRPCGVFGDYTCLENIGSNKRGIEVIWQEQTGKSFDGKQIEDEFKSGSDLARKIFLLSAEIQAAAVVSAAKALDIDLDDPGVAIVFHGGANKTPGLKERTAQIVWQKEKPENLLLLTTDYHENACELGIAQKVVSEI
jgi:predicted NBD/HSP70 family sugar kinase